MSTKILFETSQPVVNGIPRLFAEVVGYYEEIANGNPKGLIITTAQGERFRLVSDRGQGEYEYITNAIENPDALNKAKHENCLLVVSIEKLG